MDNLFFYSSKILWPVLSPYSLFVILLTLSLLLLLFNYLKAAKVLLTLLTLGILLLSFFSVGDVILHPLESRFKHNPELPERVDGIIVLGGSVQTSASAEWQQLETNSSHERLSTFIQLAHRYPQAKLVFTGGNGSLNRNRPTEADIISQYLVNEGILPERLMLENRSRNSAENVLYSKQLIQPGPSENWILITTAFHMPRSIGLFCQQDWPVLAYPVDHHTLPSQLYQFNYRLADHANNLELATHEWLGLIAYFLTGKIDSLLPQGCNQAGD